MGVDLVLVTGGSGFVGAHCILRLLEAGYRVRATLRNLGRGAQLRAMLEAGGAAAAAGADGRLELIQADLLSDAAWPEAAAGCRYALHVASPFPSRQPRREDELILPAREGTLRVLRAARDGGLQRVVITSSFAAVGYSPKSDASPYTEEDWTDPDDKGLNAYVRSKTLAERAAWDFIAREGGALELAVVNPVGIFGPILGPELSSSVELLRGLLTGATPAVPRIASSIVDVRDVAELHLLAMTASAAKGQRFLAAAGEPMNFPEIARFLREKLGPIAARVPTRVMPDFALKLLALFDPPLRAVASQLGRNKRVSTEKARRLLGWSPRSNEASLLASAESLARFGLIKAAGGR